MKNLRDAFFAKTARGAVDNFEQQQWLLEAADLRRRADGYAATHSTYRYCHVKALKSYFSFPRQFRTYRSEIDQYIKTH